MKPPVLAGWRDASFTDSPGYASRYHVAENGTDAACSRSISLIEETIGRADLVPMHMRCQRPGCRKRWPPCAS
jgi:hypothetical protein